MWIYVRCMPVLMPFFSESTRCFLLKIMNKMASHESNKGSAKSLIVDEMDTTAQLKINEKKSLTASPSIDQHDEPSDKADADVKEKKNSTSDVTDDCTIQKNDSANTESENKDDLKPLVIDKNKQDDTKTDEKQETQNPASLADSQNIDEEQEVKSEGSKASPTKGESVSPKRKRKTSRLGHIFKSYTLDIIKNMLIYSQQYTCGIFHGGE